MHVLQYVDFPAIVFREAQTFFKWKMGLVK